MSNQLSTQTISFYGSDLITLKLDDVIYTAVRPIVEALGLSWGSQQRKLENSKGKFSCTHMKTTGSDGKTYEMLCMPLKKLNGWLFSINPEKVRPDLKEKVIRYQEECFEALYNYWHFGKAERKTTVDERTGLRDAVNMLVSKKRLSYSEGYNLIHQRFNVQSIEDLSQEQLPMAVEYIHKICLEGELITDIPKEDVVEVPLYTFKAIMQHSRLSQKLATQTEHIHRTLFDLLGLERYVRNELAALAYDVRSEFNEWLRRGEDILIKADPNCAERIRLS
ncbi:phage antirepressor N-terminal domain-containing protein [Haemophilus haemoglobinophilus]|nr:phage antirepressor N-terminal domain-containing protein [Canicola haemoglobinophilus]